MPAPSKTQEKIIQVLDMAADAALGRLGNDADISLKEYKEILALLIKAAEQIAKYQPAEAKSAKKMTKTDATLLERYVERQQRPR